MHPCQGGIDVLPAENPVRQPDPIEAAEAGHRDRALQQYGDRQQCRPTLRAIGDRLEVHAGRADDRVPRIFGPSPIRRSPTVHLLREDMLNRAAHVAGANLQVIARIDNRAREATKPLLKRRRPVPQSVGILRAASERRGFAAQQLRPSIVG